MFYLQTLNSHSGYFLGTMFFYARPEKTEMQREKACSGPTSVTCLRKSSSFLYCTVKKSCSGRVFYRRLDFRLPSITKPVRVSSLNEASADRKDGRTERMATRSTKSERETVEMWKNHLSTEGPVKAKGTRGQKDSCSPHRKYD